MNSVGASHSVRVWSSLTRDEHRAPLTGPTQGEIRNATLDESISTPHPMGVAREACLVPRFARPDRGKSAGAGRDALGSARLDQQAKHQKRLEEAVRERDRVEANDAAKRFIELERELVGEFTPAVVATLRQIAALALQDKDDATAVKHLRRALEVERKLHDDAHWHVSDMRRELAYAEALSKLSIEQRERVASLSTASSLGDLRHALVVQRHAVGERTPNYAMVLEQLAWTLRADGNLFASAIWAERCLALREEIEGRRHPSYLRILRLQAHFAPRSRGERRSAEDPRTDRSPPARRA